MKTHARLLTIPLALAALLWGCEEPTSGPPAATQLEPSFGKGGRTSEWLELAGELQSAPQPVSRKEGGRDVTWESEDFQLTLAFSEEDFNAMEDPDAPVEGECPVARDYLLRLQDLPQPLMGTLGFTISDDNTTALFQFDVEDPFNEDENHSYRLFLTGGSNQTGDLTVEGNTYIIDGSFVSIKKYLRRRSLESPWCKLNLADFTVTVTG